MSRPPFAVAALLLSLALPAVGLGQGRPGSRSDDFILGYASRVLETELQADPAALTVAGGVVTYPAPGLGQLERDRLRRVLSGVPGVVAVELPEAGGPTSGGPTSGGPQLATDADASGGQSATAGERPAARASSERRPDYVLARGRLFEPLLADPKWPHFFASYTNYTDGGAGADGLDNAARVGFGETISFYRRELGGDDRADTGRRLDAGLQAAVFALFDLDAASHDLINADYFVGPYVAYRGGDLSAIARVYHQSSHLGDEFLLRSSRGDADRVNLSFEAVDLLASYELPEGFRAYGGGSYLFHREPSDLDPFAVQYGGEWRSRRTYADGYLRPIAAADLQHREETNWDLDLSLRAGVQLEDPSRFSQQLQLLLEYYNGRSPNGQFYDDRIQYLGLGLHLYF